MSEQTAHEWFTRHFHHVIDLLASGVSEIEPFGSDANRPEFWKGCHWRYWLVEAVNSHAALLEVARAAEKVLFCIDERGDAIIPHDVNGNPVNALRSALAGLKSKEAGIGLDE